MKILSQDKEWPEDEVRGYGALSSTREVQSPAHTHKEKERGGGGRERERGRVRKQERVFLTPGRLPLGGYSVNEQGLY